MKHVKEIVGEIPGRTKGTHGQYDVKHLTCRVLPLFLTCLLCFAVILHALIKTSRHHGYEITLGMIL